MVYRLVCTNGMIAGSELRRQHVGRGLEAGFDGAQEFFRDETRRADDRALWLKVVDTVEAAMNDALFLTLVEKLKIAAGEIIDAKPATVIEVVAHRFGLTENEQEGVLNHLARNEDYSRYGLLNAVTRAAEDAVSYDRAVELERIGGYILELGRSAFSRN